MGWGDSATDKAHALRTTDPHSITNTTYGILLITRS